MSQGCNWLVVPIRHLKKNPSVCSLARDAAVESARKRDPHLSLLAFIFSLNVTCSRPRRRSGPQDVEQQTADPGSTLMSQWRRGDRNHTNFHFPVVFISRFAFLIVHSILLFVCVLFDFFWPTYSCFSFSKNLCGSSSPLNIPFRIFVFRISARFHKRIRTQWSSTIGNRGGAALLSLHDT